MLSRAPGLGKVETGRRFQALFGVSSETCAVVWDLLTRFVPQSGKPVHLLWALLFLKLYASEHGNELSAGVDEKTFRKWSWNFIYLIAKLRVINWNSRESSRMYGRCRVSVDGTDFCIYESTLFDSKWYSHKFKGPGLRLVGICVEKGNIVWTHCHFPCGSFSDVNIFRLALKQALSDQEDIVADGGYGDEKCRTPTHMNSYRTFETIVFAPHVTVNRRFKQVFVLSHRFRHELYLHSRCFHAVANLVEIMIKNGEPFFNVTPV